MHRHELPHADSQLEIQVGVLYFIVGEATVDFERAFSGAHCPLPLIRPGNGSILSQVWHDGPDGDYRVARKFHYIPAVIMDDVDQLTKVFVQDAHQSFDPRRSFFRHLFSEESKTRNIRKQDCSLEILCNWSFDRGGVRDDPVLDQLWNIAGEKLRQRYVGHSDDSVMIA